jgi:flavodoxin
MKTLVVYYSFEGNTRYIAERIASAAGADMQELKPVNDIPSKGFMKYVWGGRAVFKKQAPELQPLGKDPSSYDVVFLGTPVWAFTFAPALRTFFDICRLQGKKVALFCCCGGSKGKTFERMRERLEGNRILGEIVFVEPLSRSKDESGREAEAWARRMAEAAQS